MRVACLFIPHFAVVVEHLRQPGLRDQPLVVGGAPEERKVVLDCSPEAEQQGIHPGMSLREALSRCREAAFVEAHHTLYQETALAMELSLTQISPLVEPAGLGRAFVGLAGLQLRYPTELGLATALGQAVEHAVKHKPRVGLAEGKFAAYAAALFSSPAKPRIVRAGEIKGFLAKLPAIYLPVSQEMQQRLLTLGLRTIGQLAALPLGAVQAQFGLEGRLAWELAQGIDNSPLVPGNSPTTLAEQLSFPAPVISIDALLAATRYLLNQLINRPEFRYRAARGLTFRMVLTNGHTWERSVTFREPLSASERMLLALQGKLGEIVLSAPIEGIELIFSDICAEGGAQGGLFVSERVRQVERLNEAVQQLKSRYGRTPISKVVEVEPWSRIPERRLALIDYDP